MTLNEMTSEKTYTLQALPRSTCVWVDVASGLYDDETYLFWDQVARGHDMIVVGGTKMERPAFIAFRFVEE